MKLSCLKPAFLAAACMGLVSPASAQWNEGGNTPLPLKADGTVDVDAPAPRAADGRPDFSGLWATVGTFRAADVEGTAKNMELYGTRNIPLSVQFERGGESNLPKAQIPYQPWALQIASERVAREGADDPASKCLPVGSLVQYYIPPILEIVQRPDRVVLLFESTMAYRQVFMDGRSLPEDPVATYNGYSIARWEGDTLVVESIGYNGKVWIDNLGSPTTEQLRVTERWTRSTFGTMEVELTFDDPGAFTRPYVKRHILRYDPSPGMMETYCLDENRFVDQMGPPSAPE